MCKIAQDLWLFNPKNTRFQNSHTHLTILGCVWAVEITTTEINEIPLSSFPFLLAFQPGLSAASVQQGPDFNTRFIPALSLLFAPSTRAEYQIKSRFRGCLLFFPSLKPTQLCRPLLPQVPPAAAPTQIKNPSNPSNPALSLLICSGVGDCQDPAGASQTAVRNGNTWNTSPALTTQWQQNQDTAQTSPASNLPQQQSSPGSGRGKERNGSVKMH